VIRLVAEAVKAGARQRLACEHFGIPARTLQRWQKQEEDRRGVAKFCPTNQLSVAERKRLLEVMNSPEFRDRSPKQIVPLLADEGTYLASEATMYRVLRAEGQSKHRAACRPPTPRPLPAHVATGPNQVWSWDITWLSSTVRGTFFYLYLIVDVWSRKVVGWEVHEREGHELAAELIARICRDEGIDAAGLVLHSDNGAPMKGATMLATMRRLGILASFSRPGVSDDNPYSEALFRTMKYRPSYPTKPFAGVDAARAWVAEFVRWYNAEHLHSAIRFVTPAARHAGTDIVQLARRAKVYRRARERHPDRWSGPIRNWAPVTTVVLHPEAAQPPHTGAHSRSEEAVKVPLVGEESRRHAARGRGSLTADERRLSA
jgi:transposase InsO family protein